MSDALVVSSYTALRDQILQVLLEGRERARQAVEQERVHTYWEIGRLLHAHLLENEQRAGYGEQVLARLSADLDLSQSLLYLVLEVYRAFPILQTSGKLTWSHYQALVAVPDQKARRSYLRAAEKGGWSVRQLRAQIRAGADLPVREDGRPGKALSRLIPRRGALYTYRLVEGSAGQGLCLDLGFGVRHWADLGRTRGAVAGKVVQSECAGKRYRFSLLSGQRPRLYTYRAGVERVVDGDTLWVEIDVGFAIWVRQKLRLRGIDAPELSRRSGQRARAFVEERLALAPCIALCTSRADKYDRYLADVFYLEGEGDAGRVVEQGIYLNQQLLDQGLAARQDG